MGRAKNFVRGPEDIERQRKAHEQRAAAVGGSDMPFTPERGSREHPWPEDHLEALSRPVQFTVSFDSLPMAAKQMRILSDAVVHARSVLYDLNRSQQRKRLDLRFLLKQAADEIRDLRKPLKDPK